MEQLTGITGLQVLELTTLEILSRISMAFILGSLVAFTYRTVHKGFSYSYNLVVAMVLLCMTSATVLMVIDNSLARAFGLIGALAMIRFRMPIKDAKDIVFVFLAIAGGITSGVGAFKIGVIGVTLICLVCFLFFFFQFGGPKKHEELLVKAFLGNQALQKSGSDLDPILKKFCFSYSLVELQTEKEKNSEIIYSVKLAKSKLLQEMITALSSLAGVQKVVVLSAFNNLDLK